MPDVFANFTLNVAKISLKFKLERFDKVFVQVTCIYV